MGSRSIQLWLPFLGDTGQPLDPASTDRQVYRNHDSALECRLVLSCRSQQLCWYPRASLHAWNVRGQHISSYHVDCVHILRQVRAAAANVYLSWLQRHVDDGRVSARLWPWPCQQCCDPFMEAHLSGHWLVELCLERSLREYRADNTNAEALTALCS